MKVRFCTWCHMWHSEDKPHLTKQQLKESDEYDVYEANETHYFSNSYVEERGLKPESQEKH